MQQFRRWIATLSSLVVAAASFALSYVALRDVAAEVGAVPRHLAWLVPIVIDGGIMCGSAVIWSSSKEDGRRPLFPFLFVASMVSISVVVNANHAADNLLAKVIAALPPLILLGTLELVASQGRKHAAAPQPPRGGTPARSGAAPRQNWSSSVLTPAPAMAMNPASVFADDLADGFTGEGLQVDAHLVEEIEESFASVTRQDRQTARPAPQRRTPSAPRPGVAGAKRAPRVQAAEPDDVL